MTNTIYKNRFQYVQQMNDFIEGKLDGKAFSKWFLSKRTQDLREDKIQYPELHELMSHLLNLSIKEYKQKYNQLVRPLLLYSEDSLFLELFDELQSVDIEDFWPKDDPAFEEGVNIDEEELRRRVKDKLSILEENKDRW